MTSKGTEAPVVLVVENEEWIREIIRLTLLPLGLGILEASDLGEARTRLSEYPSLVILDFYLEPEAGTELLDDVPPSVPVLLLTASIETSGLQQKYPRISAVLRKPFDSRELRTTVRALLGPALTGSQ